MGYPSTYHTKTFNVAARKWARRARLGWVKSATFGHSWGSAFDLRKDENIAVTGRPAKRAELFGGRLLLQLIAILPNTGPMSSALFPALANSCCNTTRSATAMPVLAERSLS